MCRSYRTLSVPSSRHITFLSACLVSYFQVVSLALSGGEQAPTLPLPDVAAAATTAAADCMHADSGGLCRHIREVFICDTEIPPEIMMYCSTVTRIKQRSFVFFLILRAVLRWRHILCTRLFNVHTISTKKWGQDQ